MFEKPPALLVGDALALDFINTYVNYPGNPVDHLDSGKGLLAWLALVKLIEFADVDRIRREMSVAELDVVAAEARELREWFRDVLLEGKGRAGAVDAVEVYGRLNTLLKADDTFNTIVAGDDDRGPPLRLRPMRRFRSPRSLLLPIADTLARFLCEDSFANVKTCQGTGCRLMFADYSLDGARRWCSDDLCGDPAWRAKHYGASAGAGARSGRHA